MKLFTAPRDANGNLVGDNDSDNSEISDDFALQFDKVKTWADSNIDKDATPAPLRAKKSKKNKK